MMTGEEITQAEHELMRMMGGERFLQTDVSAGAENAFLAAIISVTNTQPVHIGFTFGYKELQNPAMVNLLAMNAYDAKPIEIITAREIDPELDFLIINAPSLDYSPEDILKLENWLSNKGRLGRTLIYFAHDRAVTPNLDAFFRDFGVVVEREFVVQRDPRFSAPMMLSGIPMDVQLLTPHEFTEGLNPSLRVFGDVLRHTRRLVSEGQWNSDGVWSGVRRIIRTSPVITTHPGAALVPFAEIPEDGMSNFDYTNAQFGSFPIGVRSDISVDIDGEFEPARNHVLVFGSATLFSGEIMLRPNTNNAALFMNIMNEMSGRDSDIPTVTPHTFAAPMFELTREQAEVIGVIFAIVLPLVLVATGVAVWIKRIRR
jgi:hypothetical protein